MLLFNWDNYIWPIWNKSHKYTLWMFNQDRLRVNRQLCKTWLGYAGNIPLKSICKIFTFANVGFRQSHMEIYTQNGQYQHSTCLKSDTRLIYPYLCTLHIYTWRKEWQRQQFNWKFWQNMQKAFTEYKLPFTQSNSSGILLKLLFQLFPYI